MHMQTHTYIHINTACEQNPGVFAWIHRVHRFPSSGVCRRVSAQLLPGCPVLLPRGSPVPPVPQNHVRARPSARRGPGESSAHTREPGFAPESDNQLFAESGPLMNPDRNIVFEFPRLPLPFT